MDGNNLQPGSQAKEKEMELPDIPGETSRSEQSEFFLRDAIARGRVRVRQLWSKNKKGNPRGK